MRPGGWAALIVLVCLAGAYPAWVYGKAYAVLHHRYPLAHSAPLPKAGPGDVAAGRHLAAVYGCADCHGDDLRGRPFPHPDPFLQVTAANLTLKARRYSDADFERVIRQGVMPSGESVEFMPSNAFVHISDEDLSSLLAYLRSLPPGGDERPEWRVGWKAMRALASGAFPPGQALMGDARRLAPRDVGPQFAPGWRLVSVACVECHGAELKGVRGGPPDLAIVAAYDPADFHRLMRTGVAAGGREVGMMSAVARKRFSHLTDAEVESVRSYLVARANAPAS
jgi:mono/diheme cytochrome c family protein